MMDENNTDAIYEFGKEIVIKTRDEAIECAESFLKGETFGSERKKLLEELEKTNLTSRDLNVIKLILVSTIDLTINSLFQNFEESLGKYKIVAQDKKESDFDIVTESDGLGMGQYVFIDEFSKYKTVHGTIEENALPEEWKLEKESN